MPTDPPSPMKLTERIALVRAGTCPRCKKTHAVKPADVTTFKLAGTTEPAPYTSSAWEGFRCEVCGNEIAIGKDSEVILDTEGIAAAMGDAT